MLSASTDVLLAETFSVSFDDVVLASGVDEAQPNRLTHKAVKIIAVITFFIYFLYFISLSKTVFFIAIEYG